MRLKIEFHLLCVFASGLTHLFSNRCGGCASRPLQRKGGAKELREDATVGPHPQGMERSSRKNFEEKALQWQAEGNRTVVSVAHLPTVTALLAREW